MQKILNKKTFFIVGLCVVLLVFCSLFILKDRVEKARNIQDVAQLTNSLIAKIFISLKPFKAAGIDQIMASNTKWKKRKSPYHLEGTIVILPGVTLTIEPGVEVLMGPGTLIRCQGAIVAKGKKNLPIKFSSKEKGTYWDTLICVNSADGKTEGYATNYFEHCIVERGRGLVMNSCKAVIHSNIFRENVSSPLRVEFAECEIKNNTFFDNSTLMESESGNGSGIMVYSGKKVDVIDNEIYNNYSVGGRDGGGGIYAFAYDEGEISIIGNSVKKNKSDRNGGGIVAYKCLVKDNLVDGNTAAEKGGGIFSVQCTLINNKIINNAAEKGGGIFSDNCQITGNLITGNNAPVHSGGGIYYYGVGELSENTFIKNGSITDQSGETIMVSGNPHLNRNNIIANFGHAIRLESHSLSPDMDAIGNYWGTDDEEKIKELVYDWLDDSAIGLINWSDYKKSAVLNACGIPDKEDLTLSVKVRTKHPGEIWGTVEEDMIIGEDRKSYKVVDNILVKSGKKITILPGTKLYFLKNRSMRVRGTILAKGQLKDKIIFTGDKEKDAFWDNIILENRSEGENQDGIIDEIPNESLMKYCIVENSKGIIMDGIGVDLSFCEIRNNRNSGITIKDAQANIFNCKIYGNKSSSNGGGIYVYGSKLVHVSKNMIFDNHADEDGGGIFAYGNRSNTAVNMIENTIKDNTCDGDGGGVWASRSSIMKNKIIKNVSLVNGGGIYASFALINDNKIHYNYANQGGGAYAETNSSFERNSIKKNIAKDELGGGVYLNFWGMSVKNEIFKSNIVENNKSESENGNGGVCLTGAMVFHNNVIVNNSGTQLYNMNPSDEENFEAKNCYWGTIENEKINDFIYDGNDDNSLSIVDFAPYAKTRKDAYLN